MVCTPDYVCMLFHPFRPPPGSTSIYYSFPPIRMCSCTYVRSKTLTGIANLAWRQGDIRDELAKLGTCPGIYATGRVKHKDKLKGWRKDDYFLLALFLPYTHTRLLLQAVHNTLGNIKFRFVMSFREYHHHHRRHHHHHSYGASLEWIKICYNFPASRDLVLA